MARRFAIRTTFEGAVAHEVRYWLGLTVEERRSPQLSTFVRQCGQRGTLS